MIITLCCLSDKTRLKVSLHMKRSPFFYSEVAGVTSLVLLGHFLQCVPLCDWSSRVGQHIAPVAQLRASRVAAEDDPTDGF